VFLEEFEEERWDKRRSLSVMRFLANLEVIRRKGRKNQKFAKKKKIFIENLQSQVL